MMDCFVCGTGCGYPVCNDCTREGYDVHKIISGEQTPKVVVVKKERSLDDF